MFAGGSPDPRSFCEGLAHPCPHSLCDWAALQLGHSTQDGEDHLADGSVDLLGTPWDANLVVKGKLRPLLRRAGISACGLHAFRHTNSSLMDRLGTPLKVRQQRLGHSDPRVTLSVYTHVASEDDARIASQLGEILHQIAPKSKEEGLAQFEQALGKQA